MRGLIDHFAGQLSRRTQLRIKRAMDVTGAAAGLAVLSPVLLGVAGVIRMAMGAPVLFRQERPGFRGRPFTLYKFRTMAPPKAGEVWFRTDEQRLTGVGRFVRRTSLDEFPSLWNVLRGDMSLVGPRPLLMEYLPKYTTTERRRHDVPPGITGWAQVNGRQDIPFSKRLEHDVWYVDNWSLGLDIEILFRTLLQVRRGAGVELGQNVDDVDDLGLSADRERTEVN